MLRKIKGIVSVRSVKLILISVLSISLFGCASRVEKISDSEYLNYTSAKCFITQDCVWFAFENAAFSKEFNNRIVKWDKDVVVTVHPSEKVGGYIRYMWETFKIFRTSGVNINMWLGSKGGGSAARHDLGIVVFVHSNFDEYVYGEGKGYFEDYSVSRFGNKEKFFKNYETEKRSDCFVMIDSVKDNPQIVYNTHVFSNYLLSRDGSLGCFDSGVFQSLGFVGSIDGFDASVLDGERNQHTTGLDLLLLYILYDERIEEGMSKGAVKEIFDEVYQFQIERLVEGKEYKEV